MQNTEFKKRTSRRSRISIMRILGWWLWHFLNWNSSYDTCNCKVMQWRVCKCCLISDIFLLMLAKRYISFLSPVSLELLIFYAVIFVTVMAISHCQHSIQSEQKDHWYPPIINFPYTYVISHATLALRSTTVTENIYVRAMASLWPFTASVFYRNPFMSMIDKNGWEFVSRL